ncbi:type 1 glutamine amidotransferase domain-containing protein [Rhodococcus kronopolitis]|uniref:Type 1 glutamine amidotransferase domain-containing protein n=1 Tax=Rhodococcus kronopolitis TaxID=1460226 RepID=A0ABV9FPT4_9NOCA
MGTVLIPLPAQDFDPTEVAVSWQVLRRLDHEVRFATPVGAPARADDLMVTGRGLDPWGAVPGLDRLVLVGRVLRADADARAAYAELVGDPAFTDPLSWESIDLDAVDALLLPGGHRARGMRRYLESERLQSVVVDAFRRDLPVAAICHGVLLAARSVDSETTRSVLHGRRTTALTWTLESRAWRVARVTRFWDRDYYRTYRESQGQPSGYMSVQQEVTRALARPGDFVDVDRADPEARRKSSGRARDTVDDPRPALVVRDGNYLSARWPGDVHTFARQFAAMLR